MLAWKETKFRYPIWKVQARPFSSGQLIDLLWHARAVLIRGYNQVIGYGVFPGNQRLYNGLCCGRELRTNTVPALCLAFRQPLGSL